MSTPNVVNLNGLDGRYTKPADVNAAIATQATTTASQYEPIGLSVAAKRYASQAKAALISKSFCSLYEPGGVYTYPARVRPSEQRTLVRVMNVGTNPFQVGYGSSTTDNVLNYSSSSWSATIAPGQEWTDTSCSNKAVLVRGMDNSGIPIYAVIYTETNN